MVFLYESSQYSLLITYKADERNWADEIKIKARGLLHDGSYTNWYWIPQYEEQTFHFSYDGQIALDPNDNGWYDLVTDIEISYLGAADAGEWDYARRGVPMRIDMLLYTYYEGKISDTPYPLNIRDVITLHVIE